MNIDKGVQVDQEKIKRQSMNFSIPKHLDLFSIIIPFPWMLQSAGTY